MYYEFLGRLGHVCDWRIHILQFGLHYFKYFCLGPDFCPILTVEFCCLCTDILLILLFTKELEKICSTYLLLLPQNYHVSLLCKFARITLPVSIFHFALNGILRNSSDCFGPALSPFSKIKSLHSWRIPSLACYPKYRQLLRFFTVLFVIVFQHRVGVENCK